MSPQKTNPIENAITALAADGYDTHATALGTIYITGLAPDSADYDDNTEPGSAWDVECDERMEAVDAIVAPHGCRARWSDDDVVIDIATNDLPADIQ